MPRNAGRKNKNKKTNAAKKQTKIENVKVEQEIDEKVEEKQVVKQEEASTQKEVKTKKETKSKKVTTDKKQKHFFKDFRAELKKVNWPTPKNLFNNVVAVLVIVVIMGVLIFLLDLGFDQLNKHGINNLKKIVNPDNSVTNSVDDGNAVDLDNAVNNEADTSTDTNTAE